MKTFGIGHARQMRSGRNQWKRQHNDNGQQQQRIHGDDGCHSSSNKTSIPFYIYAYVWARILCGFAADLLAHCLSSNLSRDKWYMQNMRYNQI